MSQLQRVILDTSTLVSAALKVGSVPHRVLTKVFATAVLCASDETLSELDRVLMRKKFAAYLDEESRREFVALIRRNVELFSIHDTDRNAVFPPCRDPADAPFLALALAARADVLVSSDEDLLVLNPWNSMAIVKPAQFLQASGAAG